MLLRSFFLWAFVAIASGCASSNMTEVQGQVQTLGPQPGKALVHFMRVSSFGGAIQAALYDGDDYIGTSSFGTRVSYQAEPGKHLFMVMSESADFLEADLLPNKTYYALVSPRPGAFRARFSLQAASGRATDARIDEWFSATREVAPTERSLKRAAQQRAAVLERKSENLPKWQEKPEADKPRLSPQSGR